jgi:hypothetical protein
MTFAVTIKLDNAAFDDDACGAEISRILQDLATRVDGYSLGSIRTFQRSVFDVNGNKCGRVEVQS